MFAKGQRVIKIIQTGRIETGTIDRVVSVKKGIARVEHAESLEYDAESGHEINVAPGFAAAGISSRLVVLED